MSNSSWRQLLFIATRIVVIVVSSVCLDYEWQNPTPQKILRTITLEGKPDSGSVFLFGITGTE